MNKIKEKKIKAGYEEALALSLLAYAQKNEEFSKELEDMINVFLTGHDYKDFEVGSRSFGEISLIMPKSRESAIKRTWWIINNNLPEFEEAKAILTNFQERQFVVGMVKIAIPGITLGKLKNKEEMLVAIREDLAQGINLETVAKINQAGMDVLAQAVRKAAGNIAKIEPELADWFFGDKATCFYSALGKDMDGIEEDLKKLGIIYSKVEDEKGPAVLAVSPAINQEYVAWPMTLLIT